MSRTVVFEASQLAKWPGMMTGIPRTMDEYAKRFAADGAKFVDWDPVRKYFYEVTYQEVDSKRQALAHKDVSLAQKPSLLRRGARKLKHSSPLLGRIVNGLRHHFVRRHESTYTQPYEFSDGDLFFISWGEAIDPDYTDAIVQAHKSGAQIGQIAHDMIPIVTPQFGGHTTAALERYATKVFPIADYIVANSMHTQSDVEAWLKDRRLSSGIITKIRLGDDFRFARSRPVHDPAFSASGLKGGDYILTVGTIEVRKNHYLYYYVYKLAKERGIELPKLVVVGRRGWKTDDAYDTMTTDPDVKDTFVFLHNTSDEELSWLYEHCLFSVYVSFYEGWGLPIAESIARGVPCIASNASSMPEAADGMASAYISPYSPDECLAAITKLQSNGTLDKERKRIQSYRQFTWDESYAQLRAALHVDSKDE